MASTVVVTAANGPLGRRVCDLAAADPEVAQVIGLGTGPDSGSDADLDAALAGAGALVHLGSGATPGPTGPAAPGEAAATRRLLAAARRAGVPTVVVLSSALVYGAWPNNPVPLTEAAPLRPVPDLAVAVDRAEVERLVAEWRDEQPSGSVTAAVLRPAVTVGPEGHDWLGRAPWASTGVQVDDAEPPVQFVHVDDVATAVDVARRERLDGPLNVAPDGWISAEELRELRGLTARVPVPAALAERLAAVRWRLRLTGTPPALLPYTMFPWVVANDRLRAAGWRPTHTNEEAFVAADPGGPLAGLTPARRQQLSLVALVGGAAALVAGVLAAVRVARRRAARGR